MGAHSSQQNSSTTSIRTGRGRLVVLAGPSAVGKSSVVARLRERMPTLFFSVSATTRQPRPGEIEGRDYHFVPETQFQAMIDNGDLLEWAEIHGGLQRSGTPKKPVLDAIETGRPVLVEVDLEGATNVKKVLPECHTVFMAPPSWDVLVSRLKGRGTESADVIARRLQTAKIEMASSHQFDSVIINDDVDQAAEQLISLLVDKPPQPSQES